MKYERMKKSNYKQKRVYTGFCNLPHNNKKIKHELDLSRPIPSPHGRLSG